MKNHKKNAYLYALAISSIVLLGGVIGINAFIDPFMFLRAPGIDGTLHHNPLFREQIRVSKANQLAKNKPCAIILGSSRAEYGLNPAHEGFACRPVYNAAVPSPNLYETYRYFQHVNALQKPQQIVLALDFFMFDLSGNGNSADFTEDVFAVNAQGQRQNRYGSYFLKTIASMDLMIWSIRKFMSPDSYEPYRKNGARDAQYKSDMFYGEIDRDTHKRSFEATDLSFRKLFNDGFTTQKYNIDTYEIYYNILKQAYENKTDVRVLLAPSHMRIYEVIAASGLYEEWETWKQKLVSVNEELAAQYAAEPFPVWDFTGYSKYAIEKVPMGEQVKEPMRWYWDSSHYKTELGDVVLSRVLQNKGDSGFGRRINSENIEQHLRMLKSGQERWRDKNPEDVSYIYGLKALIAAENKGG